MNILPLYTGRALDSLPVLRHIESNLKLAAEASTSAIDGDKLKELAGDIADIRSRIVDACNGALESQDAEAEAFANGSIPPWAQGGF